METVIRSNLETMIRNEKKCDRAIMIGKVLCIMTIDSENSTKWYNVQV